MYKNPTPMTTRDISIDSITSSNDAKFNEVRTDNVTKLETSVNNNEKIDESQSTRVIFSARYFST